MLQNIKTDESFFVDIWMVNLSGEHYAWRLEWVIQWELNRRIENSSGVWRISWTENDGLPGKDIILIYRSCTAITRGVLLQLGEFP